jgi:hypothetical protein
MGRGGYGDRLFPETVGQDAGRAGPERVGEIKGESPGDLLCADAPCEPLGDGRGELGHFAPEQDQPWADDTQRGEDDDGLRIGIVERERGRGNGTVQGGSSASGLDALRRAGRGSSGGACPGLRGRPIPRGRRRGSFGVARGTTTAPAPTTAWKSAD